MAGVAIALYGCGHWGRHVLRDLLALGCEVTVVDPDPAARAHAEASGCATRDDPAALPAADGIVVATPTQEHLATLARVARANVPVFVEKPLATGAAAAREVVHSLRAPGFVMEKWRHHPGVLCLARLIRDGALGEVAGVATRRLQWGCRDSGADPVWTLLPHDLSIARTLLGRFPEPRFAFAERGARGLDGLVAGLGDTPFALLEVSARHPARVREVVVRGSHGVAVLSGADATHVTLQRVGEAPRELAFAPAEPLCEELVVFVGFLRGGPPPPADLAEGLRAVEIIEQLRALAAGG